MTVICDKCNGGGRSVLLSPDSKQYACQKCEGTGNLVEMSEEEWTLVWVKSLVKVVCHSCGGNPWSAEGGCGSCNHKGYYFRDTTDKNYRHYRLNELQYLEKQVTSGSQLLRVALFQLMNSEIIR